MTYVGRSKWVIACRRFESDQGAIPVAQLVEQLSFGTTPFTPHIHVSHMTYAGRCIWVTACNVLVVGSNPTGEQSL